MGEKRRLECANHQVKPMQAVKRWWACGHCSHRFATLALRYPSKRCPKYVRPFPFTWCMQFHFDIGGVGGEGAPLETEREGGKSDV